MNSPEYALEKGVLKVTLENHKEDIYLQGVWIINPFNITDDILELKN